MGHVISKNGICKSPEYINKVKEFPKPVTISQLRQFLGLINFQRKFISNCSLIAKPLSELTGKPNRQKIEWTVERTMAFETLREEVAKEISLSYPDYSPNACKLELFVDASGSGAGACLVQMQDGLYKTIGHASMVFSTTQTRYSTIERELTAIRFGIQAFRSFIYGVQFVLYSDHKPLIYLRNMSIYNSRLQRTLDELAEYSFYIRYRPGPLNQAADALSRLTSPVINDTQIEYDYKQLPKGIQILKQVQGGGDSLFEALMLAVEYEMDEERIENFPDNYRCL